MPSPSTASLEAFSLAVLRDLVGTLVSEVARLRSRPWGMEKATSRGTGKGGGRSRRRRGAKRDRDAVIAEVVVKAAPPPGSRFKGYQDTLARELRLSAEVVRFRRERWLTPAGETVLAPLPAGIVGGFGPELRRFLLVAHAQGQVTTERLTALLEGIGVEISKRQVVRLLTSRLDDLIAEDREVLRAGLATARWVTVDDTAARHARRDGVTTQIGDDRFTAFRTGPSKSREAFLSTLRAGHDEYVVDEAALEYMRGRALAGPVIERLAAHPAKVFADEEAWRAHVAALGIDRLAVTPDPVRIATEGALWGAIKAHGLLRGTVIVSDDAGQFRLGEHALCWVHAERLVHTLVPTTRAQAQALETARQLIWWFYRDLKTWKRDPCPRRASALRARFDRIFTRQTGSIMLDRLVARLHRRKRELLRVLERPEIPLHTNASENDIRACVIKRKISGGTMSDAGREARDVMLGLMKTCMKLGVSFFAYLGDRLGLNTTGSQVPPLAHLVARPA